MSWNQERGLGKEQKEYRIFHLQSMRLILAGKLFILGKSYETLNASWF